MGGNWGSCGGCGGENGRGAGCTDGGCKADCELVLDTGGKYCADGVDATGAVGGALVDAGAPVVDGTFAAV